MEFYTIKTITKNCCAMLIYLNQEIERKRKANALFTKENRFYLKLNHLMKTEYLYQNPHMTLELVSEELNISAGYLSQIINKVAKKNFSDYINTYRIEEIKEKLINPEFDKYSLLAIGLEAGFNSKSTFYTVFKKHVGLTPKQYKDQYRVSLYLEHN